MGLRTRRRGRGRHGFDFWYSVRAAATITTIRTTGPATLRSTEPIPSTSGAPVHETDIAIDYLRNTNGRAGSRQAIRTLSSPRIRRTCPSRRFPTATASSTPTRTPENLAIWENLTETGMEKIRGDIANYFAMISGVDDQFGTTTARGDTGLDEETVVVFTSDHGDLMGSHGLVRKSHWYDESSAGTPDDSAFRSQTQWSHRRCACEHDRPLPDAPLAHRTSRNDSGQPGRHRLLGSHARRCEAPCLPRRCT